jgi:hypothetical protein
VACSLSARLLGNSANKGKEKGRDSLTRLTGERPARKGWQQLEP